MFSVVPSILSSRFILFLVRRMPLAVCGDDSFLCCSNSFGVRRASHVAASFFVPFQNISSRFHNATSFGATGQARGSMKSATSIDEQGDDDENDDDVEIDDPDVLKMNAHTFEPRMNLPTDLRFRIGADDQAFLEDFTVPEGLLRVGERLVLDVDPSAKDPWGGPAMQPLPLDLEGEIVTSDCSLVVFLNGSISPRWARESRVRARKERSAVFL